jgi:hypothetical protein
MRPLLTITLLLSAVTFAHAQDQDQKLMDRLLKWNLNASFQAKDKGFTAKSFDNTHSAVVKEFLYTEKFKAKDFLTGNYGGSKSFWMGDFKFSSHAAETKGKKVIPNVEKPFETKAANTKTAHEAEKTYAAREFPTSPYVKRASSHNAFDRAAGPYVTQDELGSWKGNMQTMTIDQVRELLNKNK